MLSRISSRRRHSTAATAGAILAGGIALFGFAPRAHASPEFPADVQSYVGAKAAPPCTICHESLSGGFGTVTRPFGKYLISRGLSAKDESSLKTALDAAKAEKHDSNGDGVTDIDALAQGLDPNAAAGGGNLPDPPQYGCGGMIAPGSVHDAPFWASSALAGGIALFVARRRRNR